MEKFYFDEKDAFIEIDFKNASNKIVAIVACQPSYVADFLGNLELEPLPVDTRITFSWGRKMLARAFEFMQVNSYLNMIDEAYTIEPTKGKLGQMLDDCYCGCHLVNESGNMAIGFITHKEDIDEITELLLQALTA